MIMKNIKIKDKVKVLSGKNKGQTGEVRTIDRKSGKLIATGINIATCHTKPRKQGEAGGIVKKELPISACKVMVVCPKCGEPSRFGRKKLEDGTSMRVCKKCGVES